MQNTFIPFGPIASFDELGQGMPAAPQAQDDRVVARLVAAMIGTGFLKEYQLGYLLDNLKTSSLRGLLMPDTLVVGETIDPKAERREEIKGVLHRLASGQDDDDDQDENDPKNDKVKKRREKILAIYRHCCDLIAGRDDCGLDDLFPSLSSLQAFYNLSDRQTFFLGFHALLKLNNGFQSLVYETIGQNENHETLKKLVDTVFTYLHGQGREAGPSANDDTQALLDKGLMIGNSLPTHIRPTWEPIKPILLCLRTVSTTDRLDALNSLTGENAKARYPVSHWTGYVPGLNDLVGAIAAPSQGEDGIPALIYGDPGVGKTEAIKAIGAALHKPVFFIRTDSANTDKPKADPSEIIGHLKMLLELVPHLERGAIICVDDAEGMFAQDKSAGDKVEDPVAKRYFNEMFDAIKRSGLAVIVAVNDKDKIPESVLSRMPIKVEFIYPPAIFRRPFFETQARDHNLGFTDDQLDELARRFSPPIRMIGNAAALSGRMRSGFDQFCQMLLHNAEKEFGSRSAILAPLPRSEHFSPRLINARDNDLVTQMRRLQGEAGSVSQSCTLLVAGPSGSGKTHFAHAVASACKAEIQTLDGRDILARSEKNPTLMERRLDPASSLRHAFKDAHDNGRVLLIENVDMLVPYLCPSDKGQSFADTIGAMLDRYPVRAIFTTQAEGKTLDNAFHEAVPQVLYLDPLTASQASDVLHHIFPDASLASRALDAGHVARDFVIALRECSGCPESFLRELGKAADLRKHGMISAQRRMGFHIDDAAT